MTAEPIWIVAWIGHIILAVIFPPALMIFLRNRRKVSDRNWIVPLILSVIIIWILRNAYRLLIEAPILYRMTNSYGDPLSDGVGGNVFVLIFGWLEPLVFCVSTIVFVKSKNFFRSKTEPVAGGDATR